MKLTKVFRHILLLIIYLTFLFNTNSITFYNPHIDETLQTCNNDPRIFDEIQGITNNYVTVPSALVKCFHGNYIVFVGIISNNWIEDFLLSCRNLYENMIKNMDDPSVFRYEDAVYCSILLALDERGLDILDDNGSVIFTKLDSCFEEMLRNPLLSSKLRYFNSYYHRKNFYIIKKYDSNGVLNYNFGSSM